MAIEDLVAGDAGLVAVGIVDNGEVSMRILLLCIIGLGCAANVAASDFTIQSDRIPANGKIPVVYTCDGRNISPPLVWNKPSEKILSYALVVSSPDLPPGLTYHWVLYNIPATISKLDEGANNNLPDGVLVGTNSIGDTIYRGPCPPDEDTYHYKFSLYALDAKLDLSDGTTIDDVMMQVKRHLVKETDLIASFNH